MQLTPRQKQKLVITIQISLLGILAGVFFVVLSDGTAEFYPLRNGAIIGFLLGLITAVFELYVFSTRFRKKRFMVILASRSILYFVLVVTVIVVEIGLARMFKDDLTLSQLIENETFLSYLFDGELINSAFYAFALILIVNFTRQISRKLGQGVLSSFITGAYYKPVQCEKIFMFLNIPASAELIERMGRLQFHHFINELVYDITTPILLNHGEIHQYVEDEIVLCWDLSTNEKNVDSVRCFYDIKDRIQDLKEKYIKKYGFIPVFNAGLHCGEAIKGEIGYIKSEIVYHGDVLNSTSRILGVCKTIKKEILISSIMMEHLDLPMIYTTQQCGSIHLKGKKEPMELFTVREALVQSMPAA